MEYDAITLDTNIFRHNGWHLEGGMLGQLVQFKEGLVQFVLSEVVLREIHKYLKLEAKDARDSVERAGRESRKNGLFSPEVAEQIDALFSTARSAEDAAKSRLQAFADATGMTVVPAEQADIKELVRRYFTPSAPFETSGKKKTNFPMQLLSFLSKTGLRQRENEFSPSRMMMVGRITRRVRNLSMSRQISPKHLEYCRSTPKMLKHLSVCYLPKWLRANARIFSKRSQTRCPMQ